MLRGCLYNEGVCLYVITLETWKIVIETPPSVLESTYIIRIHDTAIIRESKNIKR